MALTVTGAKTRINGASIKIARCNTKCYVPIACQNEQLNLKVN